MSVFFCKLVLDFYLKPKVKLCHACFPYEKKNLAKKPEHTYALLSAKKGKLIFFMFSHIRSNVENLSQVYCDKRIRKNSLTLYPFRCRAAFDLSKFYFDNVFLCISGSRAWDAEVSDSFIFIIMITRPAIVVTFRQFCFESHER